MDINNDGPTETSAPERIAVARSPESNLAAITSSISSNPLAPRLSDQERRSSIQMIMKDRSLDKTERRRSIQSLMDGRRRSSLVNFQRCSSLQEEMQEDVSDIDDDSKDLSGENPTPSSLHAVPPTTRYKRLHADSASDIGDMVMNERASVLVNNAFNFLGDPVGDPKRLVQCSLECSHYQRNCSLISPCCGMVFGCRLCHDECDQLTPPIFNKDDLSDDDDESQHIPRKIKLESGAMPRRGSTGVGAMPRRGSMNSIMSSISAMGDDVHHTIDRFAIKEVICRQCFTRQSSKT